MRHLFAIIATAAVAACEPKPAGGTTTPDATADAAVPMSAKDYDTALTLCTAYSKTCKESIECENRARTAALLPLRAQDGCK